MQSFVVSSSRIIVWCARFGRNTTRYLTRLRNEQMCFVHDGTGQFVMWSAFPSSASTPFAEMQWPKKWISEQKSFDFFRFKYNLWSRRACSIVVTFLVSFSVVWDQIVMLSM